MELNEHSSDCTLSNHENCKTSQELMTEILTKKAWTLVNGQKNKIYNFLWAQIYFLRTYHLLISYVSIFVNNFR